MSNVLNVLFGDNPISNLLGDYSIMILNFPEECPKKANFSGKAWSDTQFPNVVQVNVTRLDTLVGLGIYQGRMYSKNSTQLPNGQFGMRVSGIVDCGPGLQVGLFKETDIIILGP